MELLLILIGITLTISVLFVIVFLFFVIMLQRLSLRKFRNDLCVSDDVSVSFNTDGSGVFCEAKILNNFPYSAIVEINGKSIEINKHYIFPL